MDNDDYLSEAFIYYQRLIAFFAEPAERQKELLEDFKEPRTFDADGGHFSTLYPLTACIYILSELTPRYIHENKYGMETPDFLEILALTTTMSKFISPTINLGNPLSPSIPNDFWTETLWTVDNLSEVGLWSILRRLCASVLHKFPDGPPLVEGEIAKLLNRVVAK